MADWSSTQYLKFQKERTQPSIDLVCRIPIDRPEKIIDIGCGPGNSTRVLAKRFPHAQVVGVDCSANMLEKARQDNPDLTFMFCDASTDLKGFARDFDVVFSNACIQWVSNHPKLLGEMMALLRPGGVLAVQTPFNRNAPIIREIHSAASSDRWKNWLGTVSPFHNMTPEEYFDLLSDIAVDFSLWETVYYHRLPSPKASIEWYRSTGLRPYLDALPDETHRDAFEKEILERITPLYPPQKNKEIIFRFNRLFFLASV
jgi:trans-aconitate 2-methyltransferase